MSVICDCCGRRSVTGYCRVDGGHMHFACWDDHHSDPTGPWPPEHECHRDRAARIEAHP